MNTVSRTITGSVMIVGALLLSLIPFVFKEHGAFNFSFLYTIPLLIIGIVILLNKKEDEIEHIKNNLKTRR
jgi:undecaprenyl pyrophosphate phosphatase UppP